ncbi:amidase [Glaciihabitans sp. dw_435]|uniref:amidase n=1 Tax=Glaciihabitans sp. dw_435 TaxID=2720081 RepID=UPI001BD55B5B|nr:amidase family protein [Glaciihabitans sp. dw_435]
MTAVDFRTVDASGLRHAYASGDTTPSDIAEIALERAHAASDLYNAIASIDEPGTREAAAASTRRWRDGEPLSDLDGVPITFKDSFHVKGMPRWHGTAINTGVISPNDAAPVRRARGAGMLVVAKTTMPDYAMLMSGLSSQHGVIRNAWDTATNTGGSSAGAGPSVAAGVASIAVGTDMVGSVRVPAALSGLASLKPTQGRIAYDPAGDYRSAGPMATTIDDVESALRVLGRHDPLDLYALPGRYESPATARTDLSGVTVGVLRDLGATLVDIADLDVGERDYEAIYWFMIDKGLPDYLAQSAAARGRILPVVGEMLEGSLMRSAASAALDAHRVAVATETVRRQLAPFDYVLSPVLPVRAFPATDVSPDPDDAMAHMGFAAWFNRLATPAGTVPVLDLGDGLCPVSVQIAGARFDDGGVLQVLRLLEQRRGFEVHYPVCHPVVATDGEQR